MPKRYSESTVETALCIWEALTESRFRQNDNGLPAGLAEAWENSGTGQIRLEAMEWATSVDRLWRRLSEDEQDSLSPFDWEFVPDILRLSTYDGVTLILPTIEAVKEHIKRVNDRHAFSYWHQTAAQYGKRHYAYDQTEQYSPEELERFHADYPEAVDWCKWHADKYGLETVEEWERP